MLCCVLQNKHSTLLLLTMFLAAIADVGLLLALHHLAGDHRTLARIEIVYCLILAFSIKPLQ